MKNTLSLIMTLVLFVCFSCGSGETATNTQNNVANKAQTNIPAPVKKARESAAKTRQQNTNKYPRGQAWAKQDVEQFNNVCRSKLMQNKNFDKDLYCSCLMEIMKDQYAPLDYTTAVQENGKDVAQCLKNSRKSQ